MSGIGRGIAALLLAGAVAGAAAFAHQLGREAAPAPLRSAGIAASQAPPPLVVVAAPAPPLVLLRHAARPSLRSPVVRPAAHPDAPQPSAPVVASGAATAQPSAPTAAPAPSAPVTPPEPAAPVAAPAPPPPAAADRALATTASVPVSDNEDGHGKTKGHDKEHKDHVDGAGDAPVALVATPPATPLETPAPAGTEPDQTAVPAVPATPAPVGSGDRHGPDDRGNNRDGGADGSAEHGDDGGN